LEQPHHSSPTFTTDAIWQPSSQPVRFLDKPPLRARAGLALSLLSLVWRRFMLFTRFIAITGSYGKSTATRCLAAILASRFNINWSGTPRNGRFDLAANLLRTRLHHRFTVMEVGTRLPGALRRASWQIDPHSAVILAVGHQHTNTFPDLDAIAREKAQLLRPIKGNRVAVLNGDDPLVRAMAKDCRGRVVLFGQSPEFDVWAGDVSACWPDRLSFTAHAGAESVRIQTQLVGGHWLATVLGALACARACGLSLQQCAAPLRAVSPVVGRLSPHPLPCGATVLRDDHNASLSTLHPALEVLRQARAGRRIVVMGDVFDTPLSPRERFTELGRMAAASADVAIFVGQKINSARRAAAAAGMPDSSVRSFKKIQEAAEWLRSELRTDDLLLIRARGQFHMERIYFAQLGSIRCWMSRCSLWKSCDSCQHLGFELRPQGTAQAMPPQAGIPGQLHQE
jgi:UDP-N-acetylmuramyl pentapeptide synthase